MSQFTYPFAFSEDDQNTIRGKVVLDEPLPFHHSKGSGFYRPGRILLQDGEDLELVFYHSDSIARFIYTYDSPCDRNLLNLIGLSEDEIARVDHCTLPGQLCLGSDRATLTRQAMLDLVGAPVLEEVVKSHKQQNLAIFPIAREGLKYQVGESIFENFGYYCDEVVLDAHHVFDSSVPVYNRKVEMTLFKDKDLDQRQRENIRVAFLADSIASGLVMAEVISRVKERFDGLECVEVVSPLATVRGLCRIARSSCARKVRVRVHVFETLLNALPPDYYYSAHFNLPEFHIRPDLEKNYRSWWGEDADGNHIADTACAGYGWSEAFYSPRKQIQMMNGELKARHNLTITDIVRRNLA